MEATAVEMAMNPGRGGWDDSLVFVVQKTTRCGQTENTGVWDIFNTKEQKCFGMLSRLPRRVSIDSDESLMQRETTYQSLTREVLLHGIIFRGAGG